MDSRAANAALEFLQRLSLRGDEVDAFIYVREEIRKHVEPKHVEPKKPVPIPSKEIMTTSDVENENQEESLPTESCIDQSQ